MFILYCHIHVEILLATLSSVFLFLLLSTKCFEITHLYWQQSRKEDCEQVTFPELMNEHVDKRNYVNQLLNWYTIPKFETYLTVERGTSFKNVTNEVGGFWPMPYFYCNSSSCAAGENSEIVRWDWNVRLCYYASDIY